MIKVALLTMKIEVARIIDRAIKAKDDDAALKKIREEIVALCKKHPLYK